VIGGSDPDGKARYHTLHVVPQRRDGTTCDGPETRLRVATDADAEHVLETILGGRAMVVELFAEPSIAARLIDDLRTIATVEVVDDGAAPQRLADVQLRLLRALASGATIIEAARSANVSVRTAWRHVADARSVLEVATNAEAIAAVYEEESP
jgi:DNA-binding NarL/FixJ family response regulator